MNLLAIENFPRQAVDSLRAAGHDVLWVRTEMPGAIDEVVLARAIEENRVLLTFDKDFGELAFRLGLPANCGIVLFRLLLPSPEATAERVVAVIRSRDDWVGHFAVVSQVHVRLRALPPMDFEQF